MACIHLGVVGRTQSRLCDIVAGRRLERTRRIGVVAALVLFLELAGRLTNLATEIASSHSYNQIVRAHLYRTYIS